ncbi:MAG: hypothetical protein ACC657_09210 [Thiohalomonadales bacterium]
MKAKTINRRNFLKITTACCVIAQYFPAVALSKNSGDNFKLQDVSDSDYVVVNGWVLLKSDLTAENGKLF